MKKLRANTLTLANTQRNKQKIQRKHLLKYIQRSVPLVKKHSNLFFRQISIHSQKKKVSKLIQLKRKLKEWLTKLGK